MREAEATLPGVFRRDVREPLGEVDDKPPTPTFS